MNFTKDEIIKLLKTTNLTDYLTSTSISAINKDADAWNEVFMDEKEARLLEEIKRIEDELAAIGREK